MTSSRTVWSISGPRSCASCSTRPPLAIRVNSSPPLILLLFGSSHTYGSNEYNTGPSVCSLATWKVGWRPSRIVKWAIFYMCWWVHFHFCSALLRVCHPLGLENSPPLLSSCLTSLPHLYLTSPHFWSYLIRSPPSPYRWPINLYSSLFHLLLCLTSDGGKVI